MVLKSILESKHIFDIVLLFVSHALEKVEEGRVVDNDFHARMLQLILTFFRNILLIVDLSEKFLPYTNELRVSFTK